MTSQHDRAAPARHPCYKRGRAMRERVPPALAFLVSLLIVLCLAGCASWFPEVRDVTPQYATLVNRDVTISALSGSWELTAGARIRPLPYDMRALGMSTLEPDIVSANGYMHRLVRGRLGVHLVSIRRGTDSYSGLLMFLMVNRDAIAAAQARWAVEIPEEYFASARNGGISYVRGTYTRAGSNERLTHWILWFSDIRFF